MAKRARRIRYVPRARRRRHRRNPIAGIPTIVWLLGGAAVAFLAWKKMRPAGAPAVAAKTGATVSGTIPGTNLKVGGTVTAGDDLYSDVGGSLASGGLGSLG